MFGSSNTPFGSPQGGGGFGSTNTAPTFGAPTPGPFGAPATSAFGTTGGFGSPAPAPSGFGASGGFGAPAQNTGFGSTTTGFGSPAPSFGAQAPGGFGSTTSTTPFGAPAPAPSGGLFGSTPAPSGGLFGGGTTTTSSFGGSTFGGTGGGFGSSTTTPAFGSQPSTFGAPAPAPSGLFGTPAPAAPFGFGSTTAPTSGFGSSSTFGAPAPAPSGSLFGAPAPAPGLFGTPSPGQGGTRVAAFQVTTKQDGASSISLQSLTAMPQYENKSFEELRFEDYSQGNKGSATGAPAGGFGAAPSTSGGLFGSAPSTSPFGAQAPAPFGAPAPAPFSGFGAPSTGGFGTQAPAPAPFGAPAPLFGSPAPAPGFGAAPTSPFGTPAPAPGLFGSAPAPAPSMFGSAPAAPSPGGLFGSKPSTGLFGAPAPAPGGLFGSAPAPGTSLFGAPAPAPGGLFGSTTPTSAPFGAPAPAFGAPAPASGSLFGAPGTGLFGAAKPPGTGLFGSPAPVPTTGLFGASTPAPTSYFGASAPTTPSTAAAVPALGSIIPPAQNELLAQQLAALESKTKEMAKQDAWLRQSPEGAIVVPASLSEGISPSSGMMPPSRPLYSPYRPSPRSDSKIRPRGFESQKGSSASAAIASLGSGSRPMMSPEAFAASSIKHLVIKPIAQMPKKRLQLSPHEEKEDLQEEPAQFSEAAQTTPEASQEGATTYHQAASPLKSPPEALQDPKQTKSTPPDDPNYGYYQEVTSPPDAGAGSASQPVSGLGGRKPNSAPKLTKEGYGVKPSIDELTSMSEGDLAAVAGFTVFREGCGSVEWEGAVDVRDADLDSIVCIEKKEVVVYENEEKTGTKPANGTKLNRPAIITFEGVFPRNGGAAAEEKVKQQFAEKIARSTKAMGAKLISYDQSTGEWRFRVNHFSRYGLVDDDDEDDNAGDDGDMIETDQIPEATPPRGILKSSKHGRALVAKPEVDHAEDAALVSDVEMTMEDDTQMEVVEAAYAKIQHSLEKTPGKPATTPADGALTDVTSFAEEDWHSVGDDFVPVAPSEEDFANCESSGRSICGKVASRLKTISSKTPGTDFDFGKRYGRSFRVGWGPDGSFFCMKGVPGKTIRPVRRRPVFALPNNERIGKALLETHQEHSRISVDGSGPRSFSLPRPLSSSGTEGSFPELRKALLQYTRAIDEITSSGSASDEAFIASQSFTLMAFLLDRSAAAPEQDCDDAGRSQVLNQYGRLQAVSQWLVDSCAAEVEAEIQKAKANHGTYSAIFAALTGGDFEKICQTAGEMGHLYLSALFSAGPSGRRDVLMQLREWLARGSLAGMDSELKRIYTLLGGDLKLEEGVFRGGGRYLGWRRRLLMLILFGPRADGEVQELSDVVSEYQSCVARGVAPFPMAWHTTDPSGRTPECTLFRLLRLNANSTEIEASKAVEPSGHAEVVHDFMLSYHLSAVLSSIGTTPQLTTIEEERLVDGYAAQLAAAGNWDGAVYILLCSLRGALAPEIVGHRQRQAKQLIIQNLTTKGDGGNDRRRHFLQEVLDIPSEWFEEALALKCARDGDAVGYVVHLSRVGAREAISALDQLVVPNLLFTNKSRARENMSVLEGCASGESSLASALRGLFEIYSQLRLLAQSHREEIDRNVPILLGKCEEIRKIFESYQGNEKLKRTSLLRVIPNYKLVPVASFLAEALASLSFTKMVLQALLADFPVPEDVHRNRREASQLARKIAVPRKLL